MSNSFDCYLSELRKYGQVERVRNQISLSFVLHTVLFLFAGAQGGLGGPVPNARGTGGVEELHDSVVQAVPPRPDGPQPP
jgi:hypothetical protein